MKDRFRTEVVVPRDGEVVGRIARLLRYPGVLARHLVHGPRRRHLGRCSYEHELLFKLAFCVTTESTLGMTLAIR